VPSFTHSFLMSCCRRSVVSSIAVAMSGDSSRA
jgi:hypothetical protein